MVSMTHKNNERSSQKEAKERKLFNWKGTSLLQILPDLPVKLL